ncbi:MAG: hypothetical protein BRC22_01050, partial [Parcubacteria group bacterium QH_9_35_7]
DPSQKVCSENGYTYSSECIAQKEGVEYSMGACEDQTTTNERTGKEFSDRDEAKEFADRIGGEVEEGMCEEEKCPKQKDVCGVDGKMYENICEIRSEGIGIDFTGKSCDQGESSGCQPIEKKLDKLINQKDSLEKDKRELGCGNNLWTAGGAGVISTSCEKEKKPIQNKINSLNSQIKEVRSQLRGCNKQNKTSQNLFKGKDKGSSKISSNTCTLKPKKSYTHSDTKSVWLITNKKTKKPFRTPDVFYDYFDSFEKVEKTTKTKLNQCPDDEAGFVQPQS